ncbi:helix-turn-helix transcriptional regulator [Parahaliea mediterranea]|uniref:helix-turn-helix transcriptional regulator n=1 Tax=Parahaliea mediterranea TaxID=651086 RepID=UPI001472C093|nr:PAS domain-containing protein [Parahaliea mediterranea]
MAAKPSSTRKTASRNKAATASKRRGDGVAPLAGEQLNRLLSGVAEALSHIVDTQTEVVVHDLRQPEQSIVAIVNGHVSNRHKGQSVLSVPEEDAAFARMLDRDVRKTANAVEVTGNYTTHTRSGKSLRSSSVVLYDDQGAPLAALCLNRDLGAAELLLETLKAHVFPSADASAPNADGNTEGNGEMTMEELVSDIIERALASTGGVGVERMTKQEKMQVVSQMHRRGLFLIRGSVERAATSLGITKFTIYNYLDELGISRN